MKRILILLFPLIISVLLLVAVWKVFYPRLESFLTTEIRSLSAKHLPVEISAEHVSIHFFSPSVEVIGLKIAAKEPDKMGFDILEIQSVDASLDILQLLVGRLGISTLQIQGADIELDLDSFLADSHSAPRKIDLDPLFEKLKIIPMHRLLVNDLSAKVSSQKLNLSLTLDQSNALVVNQGDSLVIEADLDASEYTYHNLSQNGHLRMGAILRRNKIEIPQFHLSTMNADLVASGTLPDLEKLLIDPKAEGHLTVAANLDKIYDLLKGNFSVPSLAGEVKISGDFDIAKGALNSGSLEVQGKELSVNGYDIGLLEVLGDWKNNTFTSKKFEVTNKASIIDLKKFMVVMKTLDDQRQFFLNTSLSSEMLDLKQFLTGLKVDKIPIELITTGSFDCSGPLYPGFSINCKGETEADFFEAQSASENGDVVVSFGEFSLNGDVSVDTKQVTYHGDIKIGKDRGHSDGVISYEEGFDISYTTENLDFSNVDNLANLKLEGKAKLSGRVTGNTQHAAFYIDAEAKDVWFENYYLGFPRLTVRYALGHLTFENIVSNINSSRYTGNILVDLANNQLEIQGESRGMEISDLISAFQRKVTIPVDLNGSANLSLRVNGPYDFSHLSYDVAALVTHGSVAGENFDTADFRIHSEHGEVRTQNVLITKGHGSIVGKGEAHPSGLIELNLVGNGLLLEESETISKLGSNVSGVFNFNMGMHGHILHPEMTIAGEVHDLIVEDQEFPTSTGTVSINSHSINGTTNIVGGKLKVDFELPITDQDPFKIVASARDWNFTTMFSLVGGGSLLPEYEASLTGDLSLQSEKGGFFNSSGEGTLMQADLKRGNLELKNPGPMEMRMDKGKMTLKNFRISGDDSYFEASTNGTSRENLSLKIDGKLQIHILQIFFPFMEELSGIANFKTNISGTIDKPEVLGTGQLDGGLVKLKSFPHAFEKANALFQFSQNKVVLSGVSANIAGGTFKGDGSIGIAGTKNYPMNFRAHMENAALNVPENVHTTGTADLIFSGNWFPFSISGVYHVSSGLITKEPPDDSRGPVAKQSSYLPKVLLQSAFEPVTLDLQVILDQPLAIKNSLVDGRLVGSLQIVGPPSSPLLTGKITMERSSKVNFKDKSFDVSTANFTFSDPREINPELYITAQAHVTDYDINLTVQGTANAPVIRLSSQPPLPQQDIVSLLALGVTTSNLDDKGAFQQKDQQQNMTTQVLAQGFQQISKDAQKALNVNVQVSSQYDDTRNMATQKYTISHKLSDKVTVSNTTTKGDQESSEYQLKYSINPRLSVSTSIESIESSQTGTSTQAAPEGSFLGLDLEYKQEFK